MLHVAPSRAGERQVSIITLRFLRQREMVRPDDRATRDDGCPHESVLELANVAWPIVRLKKLDCIVGDTADVPMRLLTNAAEQRIGHEHDISGPLPKRRHRDFDDFEPEVEVLAKAPLLDQFPEGRWVAAITRASVVRGCSPPTG